MGGKTGTTTQSVQIPKEVMARYNSVNAQAQQVASTPFQKYSTNPNDFVAGINQQQYAGIGGINQAANMAQPSIAYAQQGLTGQGFQKGVQDYMNPYLQNAMGATAAQMNNVNQQQQNQLRGNAIQQGAFGGDRAGIAQANLMNQQNLAMGQTLGQMANQGYQQSAQNYMNSMNQIGQLGLQGQQAALAGAQAQLGAGTLEQQTQQAGQTALYNQFLQQQAYPFQVAQFLANIAEGTGALSGSNTTTTQPMPFFSDRRLKKNIERIGQTDEGLPIHKFEYKGDHSGQKHIGFMADEVEQIHPEAVGLHPSGFKMVDYDRASSEGGSVGLQHAGQGFAGGGDVAAGLNAMNAAQANMPVMGGGVNTGLAAAAQAIAPQPNIPQSVFYEPSYNVFADPKYQPDLSGANSSTGKGDGHGKNQGDQNQQSKYSPNPFNNGNGGDHFTDPKQSGYSGDWGNYGDYGAADVSNYGGDYASGGRAGYALAGGVPQQYPAYAISDASAIDAMLAKQLAMYMNQEGSHVPNARTLKGGFGKNSRVPEATVPVQQLKTAGPIPDQQASTMDQGLSAIDKAQKIADLFGKNKDGSQGIGSKIWDYFTTKAAGAAQPDQTKSDQTGTHATTLPPQRDRLSAEQLPPEEYRGGLIRHHYEAGGSPADAANAQVDEMYNPSESSKDPTKLNILGKTPNYKLAQAGNAPGSTSQTGIGADTALSLAKDALGFFFLNRGGVAGHREHHDGSQGNVVGDQSVPLTEEYFSPKILPTVTEFNKTFPKMTLTSGKRTPEHNTEVGGAGKSRHLEEFGQDAFDYSTKNASVEEQIAAANWLREHGFRGFGYYPHSKSMHADQRPNLTYWSGNPKGGSDYTYENIQYAPAWYQNFAGYRGGEGGQGLAGGNQQSADNVRRTDWGHQPPPGAMEKLASAVGIPKDYQDSSLWVPALAGLGSMLSSKSPYFLPALGEGLVGAAAAYPKARQAQAEFEQTRSATEAQDIAAVRGAIENIGGVLVAHVFDRDGKALTVPLSEYNDNKDKYTLNLNYSTRPGLAGSAEQPPPNGNQPAPPPTGVQPRDDRAPPEKAPGLAGAARVEAGAPPVETGAPPPPPPAQPQTGTPPLVKNTAFFLRGKLPDDVTSLARKQTAEMRNATDQALVNYDINSPTNSVYKNAQARADASHNLQSALTELVGLVSSLPRQGVGTPGPLTEAIKPSFDRLNNLLGTLGIPGIKEEEFGNMSTIKKTIAKLSVDAAAAGNQEAAEALKKMEVQFPGYGVQSDASRQAYAQLLVSTQKPVDKANFFSNIVNAARPDRVASGETDRAPYALSRMNANQMFEQNYKDQYQKEVNELVEMQKLTVKDPTTNKDISYYDYLRKYGGRLSAQNVKEIANEWGADILRYIPSISPTLYLGAQ